MAYQPYPVPTPYQPPAQGGSPNVPTGFIGPSVPGNFIGPIQTPTQIAYPTGNVVKTDTPQQPQQQQPKQQQPQNNGSNLSLRQQMEQGLIPWDDNKLNAGNGGGGGPSDADLNAVYEPTMNYLNQAEGAVRADFPNALKSAQGSFELAMQSLSGDREQNSATIAENSVQANQRKENALSAARRLYDEMRRGYQQRFGGATSAGQAANELSAVEQQRQMGQTNRDFGTTMRQIDESKVQLDRDFQQGEMRIKFAKDEAVRQANTDFQNKLLEIAGMRAQTESQKAAAKLDALNTLKQQAFAAQQDALNYTRGLEQWKMQQDAELKNYAAKLQMAGQGSASAIAQYLPNTSPTSTLQAQSLGQQTQTSPTGIKKEDPYASLVGNLGFNTPKNGYGAYDPYQIGL